MLFKPVQMLDFSKERNMPVVYIIVFMIIKIVILQLGICFPMLKISNSS